MACLALFYVTWALTAAIVGPGQALRTAVHGKQLGRGCGQVLHWTMALTVLKALVLHAIMLMSWQTSMRLDALNTRKTLCLEGLDWLACALFQCHCAASCCAEPCCAMLWLPTRVLHVQEGACRAH